MLKPEYGGDGILDYEFASGVAESDCPHHVKHWAAISATQLHCNACGYVFKNVTPADVCGDLGATTGHRATEPEPEPIGIEEGVQDIDIPTFLRRGRPMPEPNARPLFARLRYGDGEL